MGEWVFVCDVYVAHRRQVGGGEELTADKKSVSSTFQRRYLSEKQQMACLDFRLDMHATQFGMCKCGYPRAAHTLRKVVKRKKTTKRSSSRRTLTTSRRTPTKEASKNEKKKKKVIVVKEKESYEPDSIFNDDDNDASTSDVPSIFEGRSPSPIPPIDPIELSEPKEEEEEKEEVTEQQDEIQDEEQEEEEEEQEEEEEEEVTEQKDEEEVSKKDEEVSEENEIMTPENRSDSLNMQEIYLISKESNSLFEGLLENNKDEEDEEEEYDVTENTTTDDTRRTVEWGSAFTSGSSSRVSQLESENKTLRRRLVMTASKVKSLEVELALANSKKVKRKRQSRTSSDGSKRDVLEDVCKRLLGSGFHQSRVRQALRVRNRCVTEYPQH